MSEGSAYWEGYLAEGNRGMGEGSVHSEHCFATAYLAKVEGSAHSGCYFASNAKERRGQRCHGPPSDECGQRALGVLLCGGPPGMDESSAHWEYYFVMGGLASARAARIRIVTR